MKKYIYLFILLCLFITGCNKQDNKDNNENKEQDNPIITEPCTHENYTWVWDEDAVCNKKGDKYCYCDDCGELIDYKQEFRNHEYVEEIVEATCEHEGSTTITCKNCNFYQQITTKQLTHEYVYITDLEATESTYGIKHLECIHCHLKEEAFEYVNNDYSTHGALHVSGTSLMDANDKPFRLVGVSTFGLQWQPQYVNEITFTNLKNSMGANVIRLAMYTAEGGYCSSESKKQIMYERVCKGIEIATKLNMYVIVDWHMLGADELYPEDENPLFYLDEAKEFFDNITKQFSTYNNILFEIMNEPSGSATWADCKKYAETIIPIIRKNMKDAVVLVGNPKWSSDLESVAKDPLDYDNIMYTFHFYANDNSAYSKISNAVEKNNLPVFVTEHGGMDASGYGTINYTSLKGWYEVLDKYNISMVAWSLANLDSSSCMFKTGSEDYYSFDNSNLKAWGIYYKIRVRLIFGLPNS